METVKIYSPILDTSIKDHIATSPIWKKTYHEDDEKPDVPMNIYTMKFEGLKPIQVTKIQKMK